MLTPGELLNLERTLHDVWVLSVYVEPRRADPAAREMWRHALRRRLSAIRRSMAGSPHDVREAFAEAVRRLDEWLATERNGHVEPWVAFVTSDGVRHASTLPTAPCEQVAWHLAPAIAPYACMVSSRPSMLLVVAEADRVRLFRHSAGKLEALEVHDAAPSRHLSLHIGDAPRIGFHTGTRGATGRDATQRKQQERRRHLADAVADRIVELAGSEEWIAVGGAPEAVAAMRGALPPSLQDVVFTLPALAGAASDAEIGQAATRGLGVLRSMRDLVLVDELLAAYEADGLGVAGLQATQRALDGRAVRRLFVTGRFLDRNVAVAEEIVRAALGQGAVVTTPLGAAAERLDRDGGGIGANLRFAAPAAGSGLAVGATAPS